MKNYTILAILVFVLSILLLTGFQCASQEMTSAKLYKQRGDLENAEKWLAQEVEKNPTNTEAWYLLGETRLQRNNYRGSIEAYDACLKNSNEFADKINQAKKYIWVQSINQGVDYYKKSKSASPDSAAKLLQQSINSYKLAISVNPDSLIAYQNLAIAYHVSGNTDEEVSTLKEALKRKPNSALHLSLIEVYLQKAQAAEAKGDKQTATANYNTAIDAIVEARKYDPEDAELLSTMIDIYVRVGRANEAKPYIREAIIKDPSNKVYQYDLGVLLMQTDSLDEAITHFENAIKVDSKYDVALQNIGVAYMRIGDKMKQASQSSDIKKNIDKSYIEKFKKAGEYFKQLTEIKPNDANAFDLLASAYANSNMVKEAKEALEKADSLRKK
jgi:tetratricopeptide (TPR) repeat protein